MKTVFFKMLKFILGKNEVLLLEMKNKMTRSTQTIHFPKAVTFEA